MGELRKIGTVRERGFQIQGSPTQPAGDHKYIFNGGRKQRRHLTPSSSSAGAKECGVAGIGMDEVIDTLEDDNWTKQQTD